MELVENAMEMVEGEGGGVAGRRSGTGERENAPASIPRSLQQISTDKFLPPLSNSLFFSCLFLRRVLALKFCPRRVSKQQEEESPR